MDPNKLPTKKMPNATPERKIFSTSPAAPVTLQITPQSQKGDLAFIRRKGVNKIKLT